MSVRTPSSALSIVAHVGTLRQLAKAFLLYPAVGVLTRPRQFVKENGCKRKRHIHYVEQSKKFVPSVTSEQIVGRMSASSLGSTYFTRIIETRLTESNHQFSVTLWVRNTCLAVKLPPLPIISSTASLFSKMCNRAVRQDCSAFGDTRSISSHIVPFSVGRFCFVLLLAGSSHFSCDKFHHAESDNRNTFFRAEGCKTSVTKSHTSHAGIPSILGPSSEEIISDTLVLCETEDCLLEVQLLGTNVPLPNMNNAHLDFESSRSPAQ